MQRGLYAIAELLIAFKSDAKSEIASDDTKPFCLFRLVCYYF